MTAAIPSIGHTAQNCPVQVKRLMPARPSARIASGVDLAVEPGLATVPGECCDDGERKHGKRAQKTPCHDSRLMPISDGGDDAEHAVQPASVGAGLASAITAAGCCRMAADRSAGGVSSLASPIFTA